MASEWRVLVFHKDTPEAHERMRQLVARVYAFAEELDSGADANLLVGNLLAHFQTPKPLLLGVGVIHRGELVGHLLIQFENYYGCSNMTVLQYELDEAPPRWFHEKSFEEILAIGDIAGAKNLVAVCPDERVERLHRIFHGMKRYATLMTLSLEETRRGRIEEVPNG